MDQRITTSTLIPFPVPGTVLQSARGSYTVGKLIGDGQYGSVYECIGPFDQAYALKMFRPANRHYETVKAEWQAEMRRLESYRHPNIVYIHDAFEQNYLFYLALERCETSLRRILGQTFADWMLFEFARQLLMALAYLHDNGLVHSDLHGGNVLVTWLGGSWPSVRITDFGVAHQLDGSQWYRPAVANPNILVPELVTQGYTTRQSDLYQLGLLLYHMHTLQPALPEGLAYPDLTRAIAEGLPRQRAEELGTPIGNVIAKLLRRRDAYRYHSAREVWEDLRLLRPTAWPSPPPPVMGSPPPPAGTPPPIMGSPPPGAGSPPGMMPPPPSAAGSPAPVTGTPLPGVVAVAPQTRRG